MFNMGPATNRKRFSLRSVSFKENGILGALIVLVIAFAFLTSGALLEPDNVANLIKQNAYVMVLTIGMTMTIIARHIDLSVGSVVALVGAVVAVLMVNFGFNWIVAVLAGLLLGVVIGMWQGFWVAYVGIPAFIVTLGGMLLFRGLALVVLNGKTVATPAPGFKAIAGGSISPYLGFLGYMDVVTLVIGALALVGSVYATIRARIASAKAGIASGGGLSFAFRLVLTAAGIVFITYLLAMSAGGTPIVLAIVGLLVVIYSFVMKRTKFGRHIYAVGGNLKAARLSGINTRRVDFLVFVNMGVLAALAGVIVASRAGSAVGSAGTMFELDAIAASFIGGTAVSGGVGRISGAIIGALVMGVLNMGLSIMGVNPNWQQSIKGLVVVIAVAADVIGSKRRS